MTKRRMPRERKRAEVTTIRHAGQQLTVSTGFCQASSTILVKLAPLTVPVLEKRKQRLAPWPAVQIQNLIQTGWPGALACHHHTLLSPKTPRDPGWSPAREVPQRQPVEDGLRRQLREK